MKPILAILILTFSFSYSYTQENSDSLFKTIVRVGDSLFLAEDYLSAKKKYEEAHLVHESAYTFKMIRESIRLARYVESCGSPEVSYKKIVDRADTLYNQMEYEDAKKYYERALKIRPDDEYVQFKLDYINSKPSCKRKGDYSGNTKRKCYSAKGELINVYAFKYRKKFWFVKPRIKSRYKSFTDEGKLSEKSKSRRRGKARVAIITECYYHENGKLGCKEKRVEHRACRGGYTKQLWVKRYDERGRRVKDRD